MADVHAQLPCVDQFDDVRQHLARRQSRGRAANTGRLASLQPNPSIPQPKGAPTIGS